jgi:hypothetical protein
MSGTHARLLLAMVVAAMGISSAAEARHWRYHWHYHQGFYQGTDEEDTALRTFGNYRSRIEADDFGRGIDQSGVRHRPFRKGSTARRPERLA